MPNTDWDFWRDGAKLSFLDPEKRVRCLVYFIGGVIAIVLSFTLTKDGVFGMDELTARSICLAVVIVIFPALLALEMFYKGGKAGNALKKQVDELEGQSAINDAQLASNEQMAEMVDRMKRFVVEGGELMTYWRGVCQTGMPRYNKSDAIERDKAWHESVNEYTRDNAPALYARLMAVESEDPPPVRFGGKAHHYPAKLKRTMAILNECIAELSR